MDDINAHLFEYVYEFWTLQTLGYAIHALLALLIYVVQGMLDMVVAGECFVAGYFFKLVPSRIARNSSQVSMTVAFGNENERPQFLQGSRRSVDPRHVSTITYAWLSNSEGEAIDHIQVLMPSPIVAVVFRKIQGIQVLVREWRAGYGPIGRRES